MICEEKFLISRKSFAIDLATVTAEQRERGNRWSLSGRANALWYRRRRGVTVACTGTLMLWSHYLTEPVDLNDPRSILSAELDGRYGGDCAGRWDGTSYWGHKVTLAEQEQHLAILHPMLAVYPAVPPGYDGWWRFTA